MEKRRSYRNRGYLQWVVSRKCLVTGKPAEVAHHVRSQDETSGVGLKPSDYRVIPLLHFYHTTGSDAVHRIGEESFCQKFRINTDWEILCLLENYLYEVYGEKYAPDEGARGSLKDEIIKLERIIEEKRPEAEKVKKSKATPMGKKKKSKDLLTPEQLALKDKKKAYEKEMREQLKKERSHELKQQKEKQKTNKKVKKKTVKRKPVESDWSVEMKKKLNEVRKEREKAYKESEEYLSFHEKRKEEMRRLRKESYRKSKEWRKSL